MLFNALTLDQLGALSFEALGPLDFQPSPTLQRLSIDDLAALSFPDLDTMDWGSAPIVMPYVVSVVTCGVCGHVVYSFSK